MLFNSMSFVLFFPIVVGIFMILPQKWKNSWLLLASYYFYMNWNAKYALLIFFTTIIAYLCGVGIEWSEKNEKKYRKIICAGGILINFLLLIFFKYFSFLIENLNSVFRLWGGEGINVTFTILLPVGISFFVFQAVGYMIDVYRKDVEAERNFLRFALFISFFPQLVAGPIERSRNFLKQLKNPFVFDYEKTRHGLMLMLWGYFEKVLIADQLAIVVDEIYLNYMHYPGVTVIIATMLFAIQIYCDFGGYSHIAIGAAEVMGFRLMQNFSQPYLSNNIQDFWRRWHISLSSWFRDYLYIPLGGNRKGQLCKYRNLLITFLISGLWHGAGWNYVVWGGLHGIYLCISNITESARKRWNERMQINTDCFSYRLFRKVITFIMVSVAWFFFRVESMTQAVEMVEYIFYNLKITTFLNQHLLLGLTVHKAIGITIFLIILFAVDVIKEKGISISRFLVNQNLVFRWGIYYGMLFLLILQVIESYGSAPSNFIYFQF